MTVLRHSLSMLQDYMVYYLEKNKTKTLDKNERKTNEGCRKSQAEFNNPPLFFFFFCILGTELRLVVACNEG